ncbi:hypothetical protein PLACP1_31400 [Planifilum fimeticola]
MSLPGHRKWLDYEHMGPRTPDPFIIFVTIQGINRPESRIAVGVAVRRLRLAYLFEENICGSGPPSGML